METALQAAAEGAAVGEVPVGAVVVCDGQIIARAHNSRESTHDPLGHAELLAIRQAAEHLGRWRLTGCTLVTTLEPCAMCAGAIVNARLDRVVFGARDPRAGAVGSLFDVVGDARLNHRAEVVEGVGAEAAAQLMKRFFEKRRGVSTPI